MVVELINTGSELMLGRVLNTHQQWLCRRLADLGCVVSRQVAIADAAPDIEGAVREALDRADLVITTGGLGPTSDDLTREAIAGMLGRRLAEDSAVAANIARFFAQRNRPVPARTRVEAMVPEGAIVLPNQHGTAPGLALEVSRNAFRPKKDPSWLIMLPGPPRELRPMFTDSVIPLLRRIAPDTAGFVCRTLRTTGLGESMVEERVASSLQPLVDEGLELGYCARPGQVDVRLAARGATAAGLVHRAELLVRERLDANIYSDREEELEAVILRELTRRGQTLALAESCTGGCIAHRLTNVPGSSAVLLAGVVAYSNAAKQQFLGVPAEVLESHGAVSEPVARAMAEGIRHATGAHFALSVTGIAGPGGGTTEKPVGTVFLGLAGSFPTVVLRQMNPWDRETFKYFTAQQALDLLRRKLLQTAPTPPA
jgi:nicotinamide-nucleotide amidase